MAPMKALPLKYKNSIPKLVGYSKISTKREVYNIECLCQKRNKYQINNLKMYLKDLEKHE
jgi:hypothetical protein